MNKVLEFSDTFYKMRFILEKGVRQAEFEARAMREEPASPGITDEDQGGTPELEC